MVLDVTALTKKQIRAAVKIFEDLKLKGLLPFNEVDSDRTRKKLDERFAKEVLGLPPEFMGKDGSLELLRAKLAQEPSIKGSKHG